MANQLRITAIGGPTALLELDGLRLLTDPTFDPAGSTYQTPVYTLCKLTGPAVPAEEIGRIDAVLLSHDHHFDNLDRSGRRLLSAVPRVFTTRAGAERLGEGAVGLSAGDRQTLRAADGRELLVTATPARHGPSSGDRGPVIGFTLRWTDAPADVIYVSGDTVWYEGVAQTLSAEPISIALLFAGAARVAAVGPAHLTFTASELVEAARAAPRAQIVPLHLEGWEHFSESRPDVEAAFADAGLSRRLHIVERGETLTLDYPVNILQDLRSSFRAFL
jgi:L-ascorbate metabolism protein UlaG (beta-lactamase superfamily)